MISDYEQELTTNGGQLFNAGDGTAEYGAKSYDMKVAGFGNPAIGEGAYACFEVVDANDGAGTNEVSLGKKSAVLVANLTRYARHVVAIDPTVAVAATNQYILAKVTTHGGAATVGKILATLHKGAYTLPVNAGVA